MSVKFEEKRRFVKSTRHLKRSDEKVRTRCTTLQEAINIISSGIKSRDTMASLVWAKSYISGYVMHNSVGIIVCSASALHLVCVFYSTVGKHTMACNRHEIKFVFFTAGEH